MSNLFQTLTAAIHNRKLVALATVIDGLGMGNKLLVWPTGKTEGSLGSDELEQEVRSRAATLLLERRSERFTVTTSAGVADVFVEIHAPPEKLIVVGAVHIAIPLVTFGKALGMRTVVLDARSAFATEDRFGHADELVIKWPADALTEIGIDESTYVVVLTHDEKIDNPALAIALRSPACYIGALGSKKTHARRVAALKEDGITDAQIARLYAPIGIDIGARRPEEIAVSIIAQIVAVRNGK